MFLKPREIKVLRRFGAPLVAQKEKNVEKVEGSHRRIFSSATTPT
jgi:hypothetical protein